MSLGVLNNISAIYAQNNLNQTQGALNNTLQQLSSGSRINSGADDAAGLSLANGLQASSTALSQSAKNATEGVDFLQTADGALAQVTSLLNRAVTLATEASNGTLNLTQQSATQAEYSSIMSEINTINQNTEYNGINVFANGASVFTSDGTVTQSYASSALGATNSDSLNLGTTVYTQGTLSAAAASGGTDSNGNTITSADVLLSATNADGKSVTFDLTAMGDSTTVSTDTVSDTNAIAISGNSVTLGGVDVAGAGKAGTDEYGSNYSATDYVFTPSGGSPTINLGANDPGSAATDGTFAGTSLSSASQAETALTAITQAITSVASMRGTDGAAINTLTAVENVMNTQSTNTLSAENDVTATDYGTATSNMSKQQILMQTGIAALAQANQSQQLITKLLQ